MHRGIKGCQDVLLVYLWGLWELISRCDRRGHNASGGGPFVSCDLVVIGCGKLAELGYTDPFSRLPGRAWQIVVPRRSLGGVVCC